jgi:hypothetical protein
MLGEGLEDLTAELARARASTPDIYGEVKLPIIKLRDVHPVAGLRQLATASLVVA